MLNWEEIEEQLNDYGYLVVECSYCGEEYNLEADGHCICSCGKKVESPLLTYGMI